MKREEYIDKLAAQLKEWSSKIDEVETKARAAGSDMKAGYEDQIRQLKDKREVAAQKLQELKSSSAEAWVALKAGADAAWAELKSAMAAAREKFKKPGGQ